MKKKDIELHGDNKRTVEKFKELVGLKIGEVEDRFSRPVNELIIRTRKYEFKDSLAPYKRKRPDFKSEDI